MDNMLTENDAWAYLVGYLVYCDTPSELPVHIANCHIEGEHSIGVCLDMARVLDGQWETNLLYEVTKYLHEHHGIVEVKE